MVNYSVRYINHTLTVASLPAGPHLINSRRLHCVINIYSEKAIYNTIYNPRGPNVKLHLYKTEKQYGDLPITRTTRLSGVRHIKWDLQCIQNETCIAASGS